MVLISLLSSLVCLISIFLKRDNSILRVLENKRGEMFIHGAVEIVVVQVRDPWIMYLFLFICLALIKLR